MKHYRGSFALLIAAMLYGLFGVFARIVGNELAVFYQSWTRNVLILCLIIPWIVVKRRWKPVAGNDMLWYAIRALVAIILMSCTFTAFNAVNIGTVYILSYATSTLAGFCIGTIFLKERLTQNKIYALGLSLMGLMLLYGFSLDADEIWFYILANVAGVLLAIWNLLSKKFSGSYSNEQIVSMDCIFCVIFGVCASLLTHEAMPSVSLSAAWITNALQGIISIATGILIVYGFKYIEAQKGSLILLTEPVFGALFAFLILGEGMQVAALIGGGLIIVSAVVSTIIHPETSSHDIISEKIPS
ncbi:MAG TPA: DMT family transporter [bacterium]|nr:DMT family transporter [bacterium]